MEACLIFNNKANTKLTANSNNGKRRHTLQLVQQWPSFLISKHLDEWWFPLHFSHKSHSNYFFSTINYNVIVVINPSFEVVFRFKNAIVASRVARVRTVDFLERTPVEKPISNCLCNGLHFWIQEKSWYFEEQRKWHSCFQ